MSDPADLPRFAATIQAKNVAFDWNGKHYQTGSTYPTNDPCDYVAFVERIRKEAEHSGGEKKIDDPSGQYKAAYRACVIQNYKEQFSALAQPPFDPTTGAASDQPPPSEETPESLGVEEPGTAAETAPPPDAPDIPEFMKDELGTSSVDEVRQQYEKLQQEGLSDEEIEKLYEKNEPQPGAAHSDHSEPLSANALSVGDPVILATGQFEIRIVDVLIPSAGFPIRLERIHRSGPAYFGPWGYNWDHVYNQYLRPLADGSIAHWTGELREIVYALKPDGNYGSPVGVFRRLRMIGGNLGADDQWVIEAGEGWTWLFARPDNWPLSDRIPLVSMRDRHGTSHELSYDSDGRLANVRDEWGRGITLEYGSCNLVERISDHAGRAWHYLHDEQAEHLVETRTPPVASYPDGLATRYAYADRDQMPARTQGLLRVTDGEDRVVVENEFGSLEDQRSAGRVLRQWYKESLISYDYDQIQYVPPTAECVNIPVTRTTVQREGTGIRVYTFNFRGDLLEERLRLNEDRSFRILAFAYRYDAGGNLVEQFGPDGSSILKVFDAGADDPLVRPLLREAWLRAGPLAPAPSRRVMAATYEPVFQLLKTSIDESGAQTTLNYDHEQGLGTGALIEVVLPDCTLPDGTLQHASESLTNDSRGRWIERISAGGCRFTRRYSDGPGPDAGFVVEEVSDANGVARRSTFGYDLCGYVASVTNPRGFTTSYEHDSLGQLVRIIFPPVSGQSAESRFAYDSVGNLVREEHPRGAFSDPSLAGDHIVSVHAYDGWGRRASTTVGVGSASERRWGWSWDSEDCLVARTDPLGRQDRFRYDERQLLLQATLAHESSDEQVIRYAYDRAGRLEFLSRAAGTTEYRYDAWGRLRESVAPTGTSTRFEYGPNDRVTRSGQYGRTGSAPSDRLEESWFEYDERGRLRRTGRVNAAPFQTAGPDLVTTLFLDAEGRTVQQVGPYGDMIATEFNALGELSRRTSPAGDVVAYEYDPGGALTAVTAIELADDGTTTTRDIHFAYDERDRLVSVADPLGNTTEFAYDDRDLCIRESDPIGRVTRRTFGLAGELVSVGQDRGDGTTAETRFDVDALGRAIGRTDPDGAVTSINLDALDRVREVRWPNGNWTRCVYAKEGHVASMEDSGGARRQQVVDISSGESTWTVASTPPDEPVDQIRLQVDGIGRIIDGTVGNLGLHRSYDTAGRLVRETLNGFEVDIQFDDSAHTVLRRLPSGRAERAEVDAAGRIRRIRIESAGTTSGLTSGEVLAEYSYEAGTRFARRDCRNGTSTLFGYDGASRLSSLTHTAPDGTVLAERWYVSDGASRRQLVGEDAAGQNTRVVEYDGRGRLVGLRRGVATGAPPHVAVQSDADNFLNAVSTSNFATRETFEVDETDNSTLHEVRNSSDTVVSSTIFAFDDAGAVTSLGGTPVASDGRGSVLTDNARRFIYDALGRLVRVERVSDSSVLLSQSFDALGRVAVRESNGILQQFCYLGDQPAAYEAGGEWTDFTYGPSLGELVCISSAGTEQWLHQDGLQSLLVATDSGGQPTVSFDYTAYGVPTVSGTPPACVVPVFGAMLYQSGAGLYLPPRRAYEPAWGRFLQRDPAGASDSASGYVFAAADPCNHFDPSGAALPTPGSTGSGNQLGKGSPVGGGLGKPHELAWYERAALAMGGALESVANIFIEAGKQLYDLGGLTVEWFGLETGLYDFDFHPVSAIAKMAEQGMGTGDILIGMGKNIIQTPKRLWHAIETENYWEFGREAMNFYMLARPAATGGAKLAGRIRGGVPTGTGAATTMSAELAGEADAMNLTHVVRGGAGQRGIGMIYVRRGGYSAAQMDRIVSAVQDMDWQAGMKGGMMKISPTGLRSMARVAQGIANDLPDFLGPDEVAGHIPDMAMGGDPLGPILGLPEKFNGSLNGQMGRYGPGFTFDGFSLLDDATGEPIYSSAGLEAAPPWTPRTWGRPLK